MFVKADTDDTPEPYGEWDESEVWDQPYEPNPVNEAVFIDFHRVSAFKAVNLVVEQLEPIVTGTSKISPKPKIVRKHLKLVVLNLYVAWKLWKWMIYPGGNRSYANILKRYNGTSISRQLAHTIRALRDAGYVDVKPGFKDTNTGKSFQSRAKATDKLIDLFTTLSPKMVQTPRLRESIILRVKVESDDGSGEVKQFHDYEDTSETMAMRGNLYRYNSLIHKTDIWLPLDVPGYSDDEIEVSSKFTYRVFNGTFDAGGRFYGPWWIGVPSAYRSFLQINGNQTVELDYSAQHPTLLYARKGLALPDDPYTIGTYDRAIIKQAMLTCLNASARETAWSAIQKWAYEKRKEAEDDNAFQVPPSLMDDIEQAHHPIAEFFYSGAWSFLQRQDSEIAERIMNHFTAQGIPVLMIHDSFIVERQYEDQLREIMTASMVQELERYAPGLKPRIKRA